MAVGLMGRGALTFRQRDMTAAIRSVVAAGYDVGRVEVDKLGTIIVHTVQPGVIEPPEEDPERNEWDEKDEEG